MSCVIEGVQEVPDPELSVEVRPAVGSHRGLKGRWERIVNKWLGLQPGEFALYVRLNGMQVSFWVSP